MSDIWYLASDTDAGLDVRFYYQVSSLYADVADEFDAILRTERDADETKTVQKDFMGSVDDAWDYIIEKDLTIDSYQWGRCVPE